MIFLAKTQISTPYLPLFKLFSLIRIRISYKDIILLIKSLKKEQIYKIP